ncbi:MAG: HAMP domain-containing sensor histidine kinase [Spirochaetales bacterium]|uniref:histidine kinase n=1 Tax=Candidatus Thalassospirochaeta sargassi TaxID=3119039 RepID=A0AAJ1IFQ3_9SPIO|nr:HAMP domain-containing sensor histidine kinase [Spirochaetales bacterium]
MKSIRASIAVSLISVNILVIILMSASLVIGIFQMTLSWEGGLSIDIAAAINRELNHTYPELENLAELSDYQLKEISDKALESHRGRLRNVTLFSNTGESIYDIDIVDSMDQPDNTIFHFQLLRWTSEISHFIKGDRTEQNNEITGTDGKLLGSIRIKSFPLMGIKYATFFDQIISIFFLVGVISATIISFIVSIFISKSLSKNSRVLAKQLSQLAAGSRDINFKYGQTEEIRSTAAAAEDLQRQLKHNEQAQLRKLQDIVHDLKTPVAALGIQFEAVRDGVLQVDDERITLLSSEFGRIEEIIAELSKYTKFSSEDYIPDIEVFDLKKLIAETTERFVLQAEKKGQKLFFNKISEPLSVETDKLGLMRVLNNLTANALNNAPENSSITISLRTSYRMIDQREIFIIDFENEGRIDEADLPLIFDRLYRSKKSGYTGNGLGLAISKTIVEKNDGHLSAQNTQQGLVRFTVELPLTYSETAKNINVI